jgi:hypothetical protein
MIRYIIITITAILVDNSAKLTISGLISMLSPRPIMEDKSIAVLTLKNPIGKEASRKMAVKSLM